MTADLTLVQAFCAEVISGFLFSGFCSQEGVSLSPAGVGFSPFWVLVDLFTGVVAPTTCSYYLFLNYMSV